MEIFSRGFCIPPIPTARTATPHNLSFLPKSISIFTIATKGMVLHPSCVRVRTAIIIKKYMDKTLDVFTEIIRKIAYLINFFNLQTTPNHWILLE